MKHTKIFFALLALAAAVLAFGCKQANSGFTMNAQQKTYYESVITAFQNTATVAEIPADTVKTTLATSNVGCAQLGFKITDNDADKPIAKGTNADALKKRFVPSKK